MTNPAIELARITSSIDLLQLGIADLDRRVDAATLAESSEDIAALRLELSKLKASLGLLRGQEAFWMEQLKAENESRKSQGDIARA